MARPPKPVRDLDSPISERKFLNSSLSSLDTSRALEELVRLLELRRNLAPKLTKKTLQEGYQKWLKTGMSRIQHRSFSIKALEMSVNKAHEYALSEYKKTLKPQELAVLEAGVGRPPGYLAPSVRQKILTGEVIGLLLNIGYHTLRAELEGQSVAA